MIKTIVICLYGGPGIGKSTLACALFAKMKEKNISCELVREYVKLWAWSGKEIKTTDQIYILAKQCQLESTLYGKVKYVITDCPVLLPAVYQRLFYNQRRYIGDAAIGFINDSRDMSVTQRNYILSRGPKFDFKGRYHSKKESVRIDKEIPKTLTYYNLKYKLLPVASNEELVNKILKDLGEMK